MAQGMRYCTYCRTSKPDKGFVKVRDKRGLLRNYRCPSCQKLRKQPAAARDARAAALREARKAEELRRMREISEAREQHKDNG